MELLGISVGVATLALAGWQIRHSRFDGPNCRMKVFPLRDELDRPIHHDEVYAVLENRGRVSAQVGALSVVKKGCDLTREYPPARGDFPEAETKEPRVLPPGGLMCVPIEIGWLWDYCKRHDVALCNLRFTCWASSDRVVGKMSYASAQSTAERLKKRFPTVNPEIGKCRHRGILREVRAK